MIDKVIPVRMDPDEEILGADLMEHRIRHSKIGLSRAISALAPISVDLKEITGINQIGANPGHDKIVEAMHAAEDRLSYWHSVYDKAAEAGKIEKGNGVVNRAKTKLISDLKIGNFNKTYTKKSDVNSVSAAVESETEGPAFAWVD